MTAEPTTRNAFCVELNRISEIARAAGFLVPYATARAVKVKPAKMRNWLRGTEDPGDPQARDKVLVDIVNTLQIRPI